MTFYIENESRFEIPFDIDSLFKQLVETTLEMENCPYEVMIDLIITSNEAIKEINLETRNIAKETDVLSFPNIEFSEYSDFTKVEEDFFSNFEPETGELILGEIILSWEKVIEQSENYGHSVLREFSFLIVHSLLHLCGYDHIEEVERNIMEKKQKNILERLSITRE
ncbi:MAG: rRNA maturation RNase YbeY [Lachnospiraceae bacterium]